jgi:phenylacetate-CoA ligase
MTDHYDALETRPFEAREADLFARLPDVLHAAIAAPAYAERFKDIAPASIADRASLAKLPVLRKADLPGLQKAAPPFGGLVPAAPAPSRGCSPRPGRSSSRKARTATSGVARARFMPPDCGRATSCSTPSAII